MSRGKLGYPASVEIHEALAAASRAHPELPADDDFAAALVARAGDGQSLGELQLGDLLLVHHASRGHPEAVAEVARLLDSLRGPLRRTGASPQLIEDLLGDLPADLLAPRPGAPARILGYTGRGPLRAWLRVVAVRHVVERRRRAGGEADDDAIARAISPDHAPELALLRREYAHQLREAFAAAFAALDPDHGLLLRQHYLDGLGIDRLAVLHGVHRSTAARRLAAARDALEERVRAILIERLQIGEETLHSVIRLARSEVELNLRSYL